MPSILALITVMFLASQAAAGTWTEHQFIYKPSLGARGEMQKNAFDSGLDRVDAHLGRYKTLGDPGYETMSAALTTIGSDGRTLLIPAGAVSIAANTAIPANVHLKVLKGGSFAIADGATLTINGPFEAGLYQVFSWSGNGKVVFGNGAVERVFPEWWGAKPDDSTECAAAFQKAFDAHPSVKLQKGVYRLTNTTIFLNSTQVPGHQYVLRGEGVNTVLDLRSYNDKYAFHVNADAGKNRVVDWPQNPRFIIDDLKVTGGNSTAADFIYWRQTGIIAQRLQFNDMRNVFSTSDYCDHVTLRDIHVEDAVAGGQFFYLRQGDAIIVEGIGFYPQNIEGVKITYSGGFNVSNIINGIHTFLQCQGGVFENSHLEGGDLRIGNCQMTVRDNYFYDKNKTNDCAILVDQNLDTCGYHRWNDITIDNNVFSTYLTSADDRRECAIKIENPTSRDVYTFRNNIGNVVHTNGFRGENVGIKVGSSNALLGPFFETYKGLMSGSLTIAFDGANWCIYEPGAREVHYALAPAFAWCGETSKSSNLPQGTYYYRPVWYNDVCHTNPGSQSSATTSANNKSVTLTIDCKQPYGFLRIWRGTQSGVYDRYVDIPLCGYRTELTDMGDTLSGHEWITSDVPSVPTANTTMNGVITSQGRRRFWAAAVPSSSEFTGLQGDIVHNTAPAAGGTPGWVCTTAGSPGTWKAMPNLAN